ncbi:MAG: hypothetical protein AAGE93_13655 [Bacteroidota bacterium]
MTQSNTLLSEIATLERKVEMLLAEHKSLREKLQQTQYDNEELKRVLASRDAEIDNFKKSIKISKLAQFTVANQNETTEVKRTINEYIKKIDKCIAHLSQ